MTKYLIVIIFIISCISPKNKLLYDFELIENNIHITKIISTSSYKPFVAYDSIQIYDSLYQSFYNSKISSLNQQLDIITKMYNSATNELTTIDNEMMKKVYGNQVENIKHDKEQIERIISIYINHPEQTQLNTYILNRKRLENRKNKILGYILSVEFYGKQGLLGEIKYSRNYLFSANLDSIMKYY